MAVCTILFEDQTWRRFRPVAAGAPVFELRCGAFNVRERLGILGVDAGVLLARPALDALHSTERWEAGADAADRRAAKAETCLFVSGRVPPRADLLRALYAVAAGGFLWEDEAGVLAYGADGEAASQAMAAWRTWAAADAAGDSAARWNPPEPAGWRAVADGLAAEDPASLTALGDIVAEAPRPLGWLWDIVGATAAAVAGDAAALAGRTSPGREPFAVTGAAADGGFWRRPTTWTPAAKGAAG